MIEHHITLNYGHPWDNAARKGFDLLEVRTDTQDGLNDFVGAAKDAHWDTWFVASVVGEDDKFGAALYKPCGINEVWTDEPEKPHAGGELHTVIGARAVVSLYDNENEEFDSLSQERYISFGQYHEFMNSDEYGVADDEIFFYAFEGEEQMKSSSSISTEQDFIVRSYELVYAPDVVSSQLCEKQSITAGKATSDDGNAQQSDNFTI